VRPLDEDELGGFFNHGDDRQRIRFAAALKAVEVTNGWAGPWLRVDGAQRGTTLAFDNIEDRAVKATTGWQHRRLADRRPPLRPPSSRRTGSG
jgi:hypothetical protein